MTQSGLLMLLLILLSLCVLNLRLWVSARRQPRVRGLRIGRNAASRFGGALVLAAAGGTSLVHRSVLAAHRSASILEYILGLTSFVLASAGVLLLIYGARWRDGWVGRYEDEHRNDAAGPSGETDAQARHAMPSAVAGDADGFAGGREAIATLLADRAIRTAADRRNATSHQPDFTKPGHSS